MNIFQQGHNKMTTIIIEKEIPITNKPINVYFRKNSKEYFSNIVDSSIYKELSINCPWDSKLCENWDELSEILKLNPHQIKFHVDMIHLSNVTVHEFVSMIDTLSKVVTNKKIPIAIAIEKSTPLSLIKQLQKSTIFGIVPSAETFGYAETYKGVEALFNRIPYWPKHILDQLPGAKKTVILNTIKLTVRQAQVVSLIAERGLTNKKIAQALNITESTVKIHVSAILKAYGVRTRTQLALVASK
jgi:DNA-binding NarL/FixJ family response regulator